MRARVQLLVSVVIAVLAATGGSRTAGADGTSLEGLRVTAETAEKAARDTGEPAAYEACGEAYVAVANAALTAFPDAVPEAMYNAAVCFEQAGSLSTALMLYRRFEKDHPSHRLTPRTLARTARIYVSIGWFAEAAAGLETYAAKYAAEADAKDALENAFRLRTALGDDEAARRDAERWIRLFGAKEPKGAADAAFVLARRVRDRGKPDDAVVALRTWLKMYGGRDRERVVAAYLMIGELIWESSCPVKTVDGLCLARAPAGGARCKGPVPLVAVARVDAKVKQAQAAFTQAVRMAEMAGSSEIAIVVTGERAKLLLADARVESATTQTLPAAVLDGGGRMTPASAKAQAEWLQQWQKGLADANRVLEELLRSKHAGVAVTAAGRIAWLSQHAADTLASAPLPAAKGKGKKVPFSAEIGVAYCEALADVADPLRVRAREAATICLAKAGELGIVDETHQCVAIFDQIDPATMGADERLPMPSQPRISDVEAPARYRATP